MNSIVLELQDDAMSSGLRVSDLLRKALVVARKLGYGNNSSIPLIFYLLDQLFRQNELAHLATLE